MKGTKDTKYVFPKKEDVEIVVGDEKQGRFYPRMKIMRWDNEVNFSVGVISEHTGSDSNKDNKVEWNDGHGTKARFYEKEGDEFEFEIELASKPASDVIELSIETKGLRFLYQPPLTQQEIDDGCERPDNVVGSYAVYHQTMKGNYISGKNYRAGKFCHIYRPFVTDANGKREWCEMDITGNVMKITIPDGLVYPVVVDPTFGVNPASPGGSWEFFINDMPGEELLGSLFTSPANADTAQSISAYLKDDYGSGGGYNMKGVLVLHSNLNIVSNGVGAASAIPQSETGNWFTSSFGTDPSLSASTDYVLMAITDGDYIAPPPYPIWEAWVALDDGDANQMHGEVMNSYASPTNPTDAQHSAYEMSIYCTYSIASAGGSPAGKALNGSLWGPFAGPIV